MNKRSFFLGMFLSSIFGGLIAAFVIFIYLERTPQKTYSSISERQNRISLSSRKDTSYIVPQGLDFISAAQEVTSGVVHIRAIYSSGKYSLNPLEGYFGGPSQSSGSGVIVSDDGYIVTNNHVIEDASQIEVVLNDNRTYLAKVIGTDPTTDLALIKIAERRLNFVEYGNSDDVKTGEWVLAIGNPFDLNSTVTAGIVSAKARNIGILRDKNNLQIESFIQTDAAVNPGNSGGALVNLKGKLIGINTAIATPTGNYTGYSFAVPVSLVQKVIDDLLEYGEVQRALLGIRIGDMNSRIAEAENLNVYNGVYISNVNKNSAAEKAGLLAGDVIIAIDNTPINNVSELQEMVARNRPGNKIKVTYIRGGQQSSTEATLQNTAGNTEIITKTFDEQIEGAYFQNLTETDGNKNQPIKGVKIIELNDGKWKEAGIKKGFIITSIDKTSIENIKDLNRVLTNKQGGILVEGIYPDQSKGVYGVEW
ncbi:trypsin-like peptidase domain-containing protein [Fulvivirga sediminis]|uniref:Trypsin-like peptidase domain-containing protein n=1 Tax=Fulvivirga sediminis TaxID=2803949 RepID=A0A937K137_9BACT|nr:trypsin-like peptidase domain-containing protein [Fulvivirga sediminis]MBL3656247.1 trypsin-like peptidase domain-containing protein [Fulvivirga sediminis]